MTSSRATASGKVILFGEHAVVYGVPAIALGIDRGAWATSEPAASRGPSTLRVPGWSLRVTDDPSEDAPLARAFRALVEVTREHDGESVAVDVEAGADLPPGGGLGCSAALGVAVARALDPSAPADVVAARAGAWERVFHGNPSGIDAAVAAAGGCISFQRRPEVPPKAGRQPEGPRDDGPRIERVRMPGPLHLCIGHTGIASSTKAMVEAVARHRDRSPDVAKKTFEAIGAVVSNARLAIEAGDARAVGQLLDLNQMLLAGLFVSTPELEHLCAIARTAGALGAKLTGAGGGGSVVALVDDAARAEAVLEAWKAAGFDGFATKVGAPRARVVATISRGDAATETP